MAKFKWPRTLKPLAGIGSRSRRQRTSASRSRFLPGLDLMEVRQADGLMSDFFHNF